MGVGPLIALLLVVVLTVLVLVIFFPKWKRKKFKLFRWIGTVLLIIILSPVIALILEPIFYSKKDVVDDLNRLDITLYDDFKIKNNSIVGLPDYYRTTRVAISNGDKERIIRAISDAPNLKHITFEDQYAHSVKWTEEADSIYNYRWVDDYSDQYIRETFEKEGDYAALITTVTLSPDDSILIIGVVN